jgi:PTH1 family peptidyl-tRNA hydrolase
LFWVKAFKNINNIPNMKIIVGLGNPGPEYQETRHSAGFMALDRIASEYQFDKFHLEKKFEAEISEGTIKQEKCLLVKPQTFMNRSGESVQKILNFYKQDLKNLLVIHDDLDISIGEFKIAFDRNSAGHKGVQSIIDSLNSKEFKRIRIGIKVEDQKVPTEKFVLERFGKAEEEKINTILENIGSTIEKELV